MAIRIYAACLASYNNGTLHGAWIDCEGKDGDDLRDAIAAMLDNSPAAHAEEWAIHDHEGFGKLLQGENPDLDDVAALAEVLCDEEKAKALHWLIEDRGISAPEAIEQVDDVRIFESDAFDLAADYAQELFEETCDPEHRDSINHWPFSCIDWAAAGRELKMGGDIDEYDGPAGHFLVTNASEF